MPYTATTATPLRFLLNARYLLSGSTLYGSSRANGTTAGAGSIVTKIVFAEGHSA